MFKRKHEFRPDRTETGTLNKLYITPLQRRSVLKWLLMALLLTAVCVVQDVILSKVYLYGALFDLVPAVLLLACVIQDPEIGSVFILAGSALYWFSGSAPGTYVIALLTVIGVVLGIFRHCYLHSTFGSAFLCAAAGMMLYKVSIFAIGAFLGYTTGAYFTRFLISGGLSVAVMPLFYPVLTAIYKIGGEPWNE